MVKYMLCKCVLKYVNKQLNKNGVDLSEVHQPAPLSQNAPYSALSSQVFHVSIRRFPDG